MSMQDLISDFVARINNSLISGNSTATVLKSKVVVNICKKLTRLGFFNSFEEQDRVIEVELNPSKLRALKRVSKPGHRIYVSYTDLPKIIGGKGFNILSTSAGILSNIESKEQKKGGELILQAVSF